jgi:Bax protein
MTTKILIIWKYLIIALLAFALGTFFPNPVAKKKTENAIIAWAKSLGFGPPRFEYHNDKEFVVSLTKCIQYLNFEIHPSKHINTELIIAQAIVESDYGRSRFAKDGNNLFGIRVWSKEGMLPLLQPDHIEWRVRVFKTKCDSVRYYMEILNNKQVYTEFRKARDFTFNKDPIKMARALDNFSTNKEYEQKVIEVIKRLRNDIK